MGAQLYRVHSGASATTAPPTKVALAAATTKTVIQLLHPTMAMRVVAWGVSFDGAALASGVVCELIQTTTVASTVTAFVANDITLLTDPNSNVPGLTLSTAGSGYNASAEGTVVAPVREGDLQIVDPVGGWTYQFPLDQEFAVPAGGVLRVRLTSPAIVNVHAWVTFGVS